MHFFKRLPVPRGCESWWPQRSCQLLPHALNTGSPFFPMLQPTVTAPSPAALLWPLKEQLHLPVLALDWLSPR